MILCILWNFISYYIEEFMPKPAQSKEEKAKARSSWQEVLSS